MLGWASHTQRLNETGQGRDLELLVIGRGTGFGSPEGHQLDGLRMYRRALRSAGIRVTRRDALTLAEIERTVENHTANVAMIMVSWGESAEDVVALFRRLSERPSRPKLVMLDYFAQSSTPYFGVLPYVDRYVKRQALRDRGLYRRDLRGGYVFTDFYAERFGYDLGGWSFGSTLPEEHADKLVVGWNLAVTPYYRKLLRKSRRRGFDWDRRPVDVNARVGLISNNGRLEWYQDYRRRAGDAARALAPRRTLSGQDRLGRRAYFRELRRSRIVFSPFGWGELCFRDYEAVCSGALLVKPSMEHLQTSPDIFVPGETYVPVKWDLSDLAERCDHYLDHPDEARRIIANAQGRLSDYYEQGGFVRDVQRVLAGLDR